MLFICDQAYQNSPTNARNCLVGAFKRHATRNGIGKRKRNRFAALCSMHPGDHLKDGLWAHN